jgi:peptide/nickel transport system substrate-binding protein
VRVSRGIAVLVCGALLAGACGDDDDDDGGAVPGTTGATTAAPASATTSETTGESPASATTQAATTATAVETETPVAGGEATLLVLSETPSLDPVRISGAATTDGQRGFAIYGALVVYDPDAHQLEPVLAESIEPDADYGTWTLSLRDGLTFTDGAPLDAEAVRVNWARIADPANAAFSFALADNIESMDVVGPTQLAVHLKAPNAKFATSLAKSGLNYIASPAAIAAGADLANAPVGAGPFVLEEWRRDDRMILGRNPDWFDAPRPYLDRLTIRVVPDEGQRVNTFVTGDGDAFFTLTPDSAARAIDEGAGGFAKATVAIQQVLVFNTTTEPFSDLRMRQVVALGVDRDALVDVVLGEGGVVADGYAIEGAPWDGEDTRLPEFDPAAAQELVDEIRADTGSDVSFTLRAFDTPQNVLAAEFVQTMLNQLDGVEVGIEVAEAGTTGTRVLQGDFQVSTWGYPTLAPDPGYYNALHTGVPFNVSRYSNADVDAALDEARATDDPDDEARLYGEVLAAAARDLPFLPFSHSTSGIVYSDQLHDVAVYEDGVLRSDLVWKGE